MCQLCVFSLVCLALPRDGFVFVECSTNSTTSLSSHGGFTCCRSLRSTHLSLSRVLFFSLHFFFVLFLFSFYRFLVLCFSRSMFFISLLCLSHSLPIASLSSLLSVATYHGTLFPIGPHYCPNDALSGSASYHSNKTLFAHGSENGD